MPMPNRADLAAVPDVAHDVRDDVTPDDPERRRALYLPGRNTPASLSHSGTRARDRRLWSGGLMLRAGGLPGAAVATGSGKRARMFGQKWEPAEGRLIGTRYGGKHGDWSGNASSTANSVHYLKEVRPLSGAEPFRCECTPPSLMPSFQRPPRGVPVKMECLPSKKKARFDRNDPAISQRVSEKKDRAAYQAELRADVPDQGVDPSAPGRPGPQ
jgi:hypothetical protein